MADYGPLFSLTNPPEERKLARKVEKPAEDVRTIMIDGKPAKINWLSPEGKTAMGEYFEAGISFNSDDHSVWKIRRNPDGTLEPIRCLLYGRSKLEEEAREIAMRYTRKA